jgi:rhomboid family GlyGly-CTERM serine protease
VRGAVQPEVPKASIALALACLVLAGLPESIAASLAWDRDAVLAGQWWRLWSAHLVHFGMAHAFTDALVLLAAGSVLERRIGAGALLRQVTLASLALSMLLFAAMPGVGEYRGASGLAAMLAVAAAIAGWRQAGRWRPAILAGGLGFAAATAAQAIGTGAGFSSLPQGVAVAWQAHLIGAACGVMAGVMARAAISPPHT